MRPSWKSRKNVSLRDIPKIVTQKSGLCLQNDFLRYDGMVPMNAGVFPAIGILSTEAMQKE